MKRKLLLLLILSTISILIIYNLFCNNKRLNYLSLGDYTTYQGTFNNTYIDYLNEKYNFKDSYTYSKEDLRITDLINAINNNIKVDKKNIKELIASSQITTISIGNNEIQYRTNSNKLSNKYYDEIITDFDNLLRLIKSLTNNNVIIIGIYNPYRYYSRDIQSLFNYLDFSFNEITKKYEFNYIKTNNVFSSSNDYLTSGKFTNEAHKYIYRQVSILIDKNT